MENAAEPGQKHSGRLCQLKTDGRREIGRYECSIPLSALYQDNSSDYVYLIEEKNTILGVEMTARKQKVKVIDRDASYAALEMDAFTEEDKMIVETDKEIKDGARVRPVED